MLEKTTVDRAMELLSIVEKVAGVAPQFTNLSSEAMAELKLINDAIKDAKTADLTPSAAPLSDDPQPSTPVETDPTPSPNFPPLAADGDDSV